MVEQRTWVEAKVDPMLYPNLPGSIIRLWGFDFKIYPGKKLCVKMDNDFVPHEVKAGHVREMTSPPPGVVEKFVPEQKEVHVQISKEPFTMDFEDYYGSGSLDKLISKLERVTVPEIKSFAKKRFDVTFPINAKKVDILDEIRTLTDLKIIKSKSDGDEEE